MTGNRALWRAATLLVFAACGVGAAATARAATGPPDDQLWTELDVSAPLSDHTMITGIGQLRLSESLPNPALTAAGADLSYKEGDWTFAVGYRHQVTGDRVREDQNVTQVALAMATYAYHFGRSTLAIRARFEDTITAASNPWRVRLRIEYRWATERLGSISYLYANDEGFYRFSDNSWFRNRAQAGMGLVLGKRTDLRLYLQRQDTQNAQPGAINAVGVLAAYTFN